MTLDDDLPPARRAVRPATTLWWVLAAALVVALAFLVWRPEPPRSAPAERGTVPVTRTPVQLPASQ